MLYIISWVIFLHFFCPDLSSFLLSSIVSYRMESHSITLYRTFIALYRTFIDHVYLCIVMLCYVRFCFVLFCFVLFCFVLFCFVLFCFV